MREAGGVHSFRLDLAFELAVTRQPEGLRGEPLGNDFLTT